MSPKGFQNRQRLDNSDVTVFYDFEALFVLFDLSHEPTSPEAAYVAYIIVHPTPRGIFATIPSLGLINFASNYSFLMSYSNHTYNALSAPNIPIIGGKFAVYLNNHLDINCCATRFAQLVGYTSHFSEHKEDPYKVGLLPRDMAQVLHSSWRPGYYILEVRANFDHSAGLQQVIAAIRNRSRTLGSDILLDKRCILVAVWFNDHIAYVTNREHFKPVPDLETKQGDLKGIFTKLATKYPNNTGRAGGRVFLHTDDLLALAYQNRKVAYLAKLLAQANNDWEQVAVIALLLLPFCNLSGDDLFWFFVHNKHLFNLKFTDWVKACKDIHSCVRVYQEAPGLMKKYVPTASGRAWAANIYGIDIIGGRSEKMAFDTGGEFLMRAVDPAVRGVVDIDAAGQVTFSTSTFEHYLDKIVGNVVENIINKDTKLETLEHWYARRMFFTPSGGAPGATVTWDNGSEKPESYRLNKRGAVLAIPFSTLRATYDEMSEIAVQWSVEALKFESAKMRGILNTGMFPFFAQAYLLGLFDSNVRHDTWHSTAHGNTARIANALRRLADLQDHSLMWDYSDFNINHIIILMILLYLHVARVLCERGRRLTESHTYQTAYNDLFKVLRYIVNARNNTYLLDNETGYLVHSVRSLQSGERGTSFTNSMCNEVDTQIVKETSSRILGFDVLPKHADKLGDDEFHSNRDMINNILACALYNLTGAAGQIYKITSEYRGERGSFGEYLRQHYDGSDNSIGGYAIRALMGLIHGEFFSEALPMPFEKVATILEQVAKLARRGYSLPQVVTEKLISRNAQLVYTENGIKRRVTGSSRLATLPAIFGGVGVTETKDLAMSTLPLGLVRPLSLQKVAICIPSGEGKSTLARTYPALFCDHDSVTAADVFDGLRNYARVTGDWAALNRYLKAESLRIQPALKGRILLSWSKDTVDPSYRTFGIMLKRGTGIRANKSNRATLERDFGKRLLQVANHGLMTEYALSLAYKFQNSDSVVVTMFESPTPRPNYSAPRFDARRTLKLAKTNVADFGTLTSRGVTIPDSVYNELAVSALTGAFPKQALNQSLADYARKVDLWQKAGHFTEVVISPVHLIGNTTIMAHVSRVIHFNLALTDNEHKITAQHKFRTNRDGFPAVTEVSHLYGVFSSLLATFNLSTAAAFTALRDATPTLKYPGSLGRTYNLLVTESRSRSYVPSNPTQERTKIARIVNFIDSACIGEAGKLVTAYSAINAYLDGKSDLIPPYNPGFASEYMSFQRSVTHMILESETFTFNRWCHLDSAIRAVTFRWLEMKVQHYLHTELNRRFRSISFKD